MRLGASWADACILNLSARGMLVQSGTVPDRGSYLEMRRGPNVIIARVVWSSEQRFGVRTQEQVFVEDLLSETGNSSSLPGPALASFERRATPRPSADRHEAARERGRAVEFVSLALCGVVSALLLFATVSELLGRPARAIQTALAAAPAG